MGFASTASGVIVACVALGVACAQQPNGANGLVVQFRHGGPYPIVADALGNGLVTAVVTGSAGAPFAIFASPSLHAGAAQVLGGQSLDIGTAPAFSDLTVLGDGFGGGPSASAFSVAAGGVTLLSAIVPTGSTLVLPAMQAIVADPSHPSGLWLTAANQVTLRPTKNVLFIQGSHLPAGTFAPQCRLADPSPYGFSTLRDLLLLAGFGSVVEVVDASVAVTPQLLAPFGVVVLGTNERTWTASEVGVIEAYVRAGGGLVSYSDFMFGPNNWSSENQVLSRFGLLVAPDNFGGPVSVTSLAPHPIAAGVAVGFEGEGVSVLELVGNGVDPIVNVAPCLANGGACAPLPLAAPSGSPNPVFSACATVTAGSGRVVATFDRNTFFNPVAGPPLFGTDLSRASNVTYATNLFLWAAGL